MKKSIVIITMILASVSFVHAAKVYLGAGYGMGSGSQKLTWTHDFDGTSGTYDDVSFDTTMTQLKLGIIFESNNRLEISSTAMELDSNGTTSDLSGIDIDYIWTIDMKGSVVTPFLVLGIGDNQLEIEGEDSVFGFATTIGLGAYFKVADSVELELSIRQKNLDFGDTHWYNNQAPNRSQQGTHENTLAFFSVKYIF